MTEITREEWHEWATSSTTKLFIKEVRKRRNSQLESMASFTEQNTITKDYFQAKGICLGLLDAIDLIDELKEK